MVNIIHSISKVSFVADAAAQGSGWTSMLMPLMLFGGMWLLLIAPQRKRQKQHQAMIQSLSQGDEVLTTGGLYGTIASVKDDRLMLKVADNTCVELARSAVQGKVEASSKKA
jgi:preprotein translocase subunit YajC